MQEQYKNNIRRKTNFVASVLPFILILYTICDTTVLFDGLASVIGMHVARKAKQDKRSDDLCGVCVSRVSHPITHKQMSVTSVPHSVPHPITDSITDPMNQEQMSGSSFYEIAFPTLSQLRLNYRKTFDYNKNSRCLRHP